MHVGGGTVKGEVGTWSPVTVADRDWSARVGVMREFFFSFVFLDESRMNRGSIHVSTSR